MRRLISLGYCCEVAFQIRVHTGIRQSHFFDWTIAEKLSHVSTVIESDFDILRPGDLTPRRRENGRLRLFDRRAKLWFPHAVPVAGEGLVAGWEDHLSDYVDKMRHLAQRFRETVAGAPVTFIRRGATKYSAQRLESVLRRQFPGADWRVLYIVEPSGEPFLTRNGHSAALPDVGPFGDDMAWASLLKAEGLVETPFRLSRLQFMEPGKGLGAPILPLATAEFAAASNPGNPWFSYEAARSARREGLCDRAAIHVRAALDLEPDNGTFADLARALRVGS